MCRLMAEEGVTLVGHSLESDLHAMRLRLPAGARVLDTALLFPLRVNARGPPAKAALRNLTVQHLKREIQQAPVSGAPAGHSPAEDALAALDLAILKLKRGRAYGTPDASWGAGFETLHASLQRAGWDTASIDQPQAPAIALASRPVDVEHKQPSLSIPCANDADAIAEATKRVLQGQRVFTWLGIQDAHSSAPALRALLKAMPPNRMVVICGLGHRQPAPQGHQTAANNDAGGGCAPSHETSGPCADVHAPGRRGWAAFTVTATN